MKKSKYEIKLIKKSKRRKNRRVFVYLSMRPFNEEKLKIIVVR